jgi:hypothetical protein
MKGITLLILLGFYHTVSFSQTRAASYIGTWDGFGYIEDDNRSVREGCMSRLVIEKIPGRADSLKCTLIYLPTNGSQYLAPKSSSRVFKVATKDGYLLQGPSKIYPKGNEKTITFVKSQNEEKLYFKERWAIGTQLFRDLDYVFTRALNPQMKKAFFDEVYTCWETVHELGLEAKRNNTKNWNTLSVNQRSILLEAEQARLRVECVQKNINLSGMKLSYWDKWGILTIDVPGLTPIHILIQKVYATQIIASRSVKLNFQDFDIYKEDEYNAAGYIDPKKVEVTFLDYMVVQYPQPEFRYLSTTPYYPDYFKMPAKFITK